MEGSVLRVTCLTVTKAGSVHLGAVALEAMMGRSLMNGNHMFMLGLGPIINASIMLSLLLAFKDVFPFGQQVKALQDQGAEVSYSAL